MSTILFLKIKNDYEYKSFLFIKNLPSSFWQIINFRSVERSTFTLFWMDK